MIPGISTGGGGITGATGGHAQADTSFGQHFATNESNRFAGDFNFSKGVSSTMLAVVVVALFLILRK